CEALCVFGEIAAPEAEQLLHAVRHEEQPGGDADHRPGIGFEAGIDAGKAGNDITRPIDCFVHAPLRSFFRTSNATAILADRAIIEHRGTVNSPFSTSTIDRTRVGRERWR